jgi:glycosyltransferase involved in cell wall biosynthesis
MANIGELGRVCIQDSVIEKISICVPVYNEAESLLELYTQICAALDGTCLAWEAVLVNDGSADDSPRLLNLLAEKDERIKVIHFRRNSGQTSAMMAGIDFASGDVIVPMDADLQNDPKDIVRLIEKLNEGYDVVSGWRKDRKDHSIKRNFPSRVANWLISKVSGVSLHDYGCSLKAYRKDVIKGVKLYGEMHRFIPIYASWHGARVTEVPVTHHSRKFGTSKYGLERIAKVILDLMVVKFLDSYSQKPIYVFGGFGLISLVLGLGIGVWAIYLKLAEEISFIKTPLPLVSIVFVMLGVIGVLLGLLAELVTRTWFESQGRDTYIVRDTRNIG